SGTGEKSDHPVFADRTEKEVALEDTALALGQAAVQELLQSLTIRVPIGHRSSTLLLRHQRTPGLPPSFRNLPDLTSLHVAVRTDPRAFPVVRIAAITRGRRCGRPPREGPDFPQKVQHHLKQGTVGGVLLDGRAGARGDAPRRWPLRVRQR